MDKKVSGKAFDAKIFKRLIGFANNYKLEFIISTMAAILLAMVASVKPILLQEIVNTYFENKDRQGLLTYSLLMCAFLFGEVFLQFIFIYKVNCIGQHIIKDIRVKLKKHKLHFKMSYYDNSSVGKLLTR